VQVIVFRRNHFCNVGFQQRVAAVCTFKRIAAFFRQTYFFILHTKSLQKLFLGR